MTQNELVAVSSTVVRKHHDQDCPYQGWATYSSLDAIHRKVHSRHANGRAMLKLWRLDNTD